MATLFKSKDQNKAQLNRLIHFSPLLRIHHHFFLYSFAIFVAHMHHTVNNDFVIQCIFGFVPILTFLEEFGRKCDGSKITNFVKIITLVPVFESFSAIVHLIQGNTNDMGRGVGSGGRPPLFRG